MAETLPDEDSLIALSALQHYLFCPRQCALIHVEQVWAEDGATASGRLLHEKVDAGWPEKRPGVRITRGMALRSLRLGVVGKADVVEMYRDGGRDHPYPVEYKRGKPKTHRADEVQLCAQAICLEEMFAVPVTEGALFYGLTRRRLVVSFDAELRKLTEDTALAARAMIAASRTPPPQAKPACKHCSLIDLCCPKQLEKPPHIERWLTNQIKD
jgi:CRISPR-associated exonuclease Cas4